MTNLFTYILLFFYFCCYLINANSSYFFLVKWFVCESERIGSESGTDFSSDCGGKSALFFDKECG